MAQPSNENVIRCHTALQTLLLKTIPCLQNAIDLWHHKTAQNTPFCTSPDQCPQHKRPSLKTNACEGCIGWAVAVEAVVYPSYSTGSLKWANVNPTVFSADPLEVVKLFAILLPPKQTYSTLGDFDPASLLMIMSKFKEFHRENNILVDKIKKLSYIRNSLAHLKVDNNLHLDDTTFNAYWTDITDVVHILPDLGRAYFTQQTAEELYNQLREIKERSIPAKVERETLFPLVEDMVEMVLEKIQVDTRVVEGPDSTAKTRGFIEEVAANLKEYYLTSLCKKQVYPWRTHQCVNLNNIYVPVTIDIEIPGVRPIKEHLHSYQDIFSDEHMSTRSVLVGNPGQGKSIFCAKLAYDWSHSTDSSPSLQDIQLLFILQLGSIDHSSNIEDEIRLQLLPDIDATKLGKIIRALGKSVIFVLDGLDEAPHDLLTRPEFGNVVKTIKYNDMRNCRVLVTTRPWRADDITQIGVYTHFELQRMNKSKVKAYVAKLFNQNKNDYMTVALGKRLLKYIDANKLLVDVTTPLMALLVSWYWIETDGKKPIPNRVNELYDQIMDLMHKSMTRPEINKDQIVDQLGDVAVKGLTPTMTNIVFTEDELKKSSSEHLVQNAKAMGIVSYKSSKGKKTLQFFHKSGQEFCSGRYLANHPPELSSYLKCIKTIKDALSVAPVLTFAAGCKTAAKLIVKELLGIFKSEIQPQLSDFYAEKLMFHDIRPIQQFVELCLECNYEADAEAEFASIMTDLFPRGTVLFYGLPPKAAVSLAYYMTHCKPTIREITLRPIAHASDPFVYSGPYGEIYYTALDCMKVLPGEVIQKICNNFQLDNPDLHKDWASPIPGRTPPGRTLAMLAAYIQCIQACEGLPCASETNAIPIVDSFEHIKLEQLNVSDFKLCDHFDHLIESIENGHLQSLSSLRVRSVASTERQITRLLTTLHKMPLLRTLDISNNKAEPGRSIPILAKQFSNCKSLQHLYAFDMAAPSHDMELLASALPSQVEKLFIGGNIMSDTVASCLVNNLPSILTCLYVSVWHLSFEKHNEFVQTLSQKCAHLQDLRVWHSPFPADLMKHVGLALPTWHDLHTVLMRSASNDLISSTHIEIFTEGLKHARNIKMLWFLRISLDKKGFNRLVEVCRQKSIETLRFDRDRLPADVPLEELDDFVTLT